MTTDVDAPTEGMPKKQHPSFSLREEQAAEVFGDAYLPGEEVEVTIRFGETDRSGNVELLVVGKEEPEAEGPTAAELPYLKSKTPGLPEPPPVNAKSFQEI